MLKRNALGIMTAILLVSAGCSDNSQQDQVDQPEPLETEVPTEIEEKQEDAESIDTDLSEEEFIEYVARVQLIQREYQEKYSDALEAENTEEVEKLEKEFEAETADVMNDLEISTEDLEEFEKANPQFLQDSDTQRKIMERIEELLQQQ